jgi:uncharacterized protein YjbI with pentapeptide repeats
LSGANLSKAIFNYADLGESDLCGANLFHASFNGANLENTKYNTETIWPEKIIPSIVGAILIENEP